MSALHVRSIRRRVAVTTLVTFSVLGLLLFAIVDSTGIVAKAQDLREESFINREKARITAEIAATGTALPRDGQVRTLIVPADSVVGADPTDFEVQADEVDPATDLSPLGLDPELFESTVVYFPLLSIRGEWTFLGTIDRSPRIFGPEKSVALMAVTDDAVVGPLSVRQSLLAAIPVGSLALAAAFALVAGSGLRPVRRMTAEAAGIEIGDLTRRLPDPRTGDELEELAATLNGMLDRVSDGVATERRFVADAAHELRSPVAASTALLEVSLSADGLEWRGVASSVLDEQRRLGALVDDLVLLARLDDVSRLTAERVMLDDLVAAEASRMFASEIEVVHLEPVAINADPRSLARVVRNLLSNADRHAHTRIEVRLETTPTVGVLHVDDDGPGIPVEERERVFERFARLDDARSRDAGGFGLGLAIVNQVTELYGGTVIATDSPLGGARLTVTFPISQPTNPLDT